MVKVKSFVKVVCEFWNGDCRGCGCVRANKWTALTHLGLGFFPFLLALLKKDNQREIIFYAWHDAGFTRASHGLRNTVL